MKILITIDRYARKVGNVAPEWAIALSARIALFFVFWNSVQTKIHGLTFFGQHFAFWNLTDSTTMLFEYEYDLPLLPPTLAAYMATFGEFFLSLGLLLGLMTRLSALGLFVMTAVIQIFVYPSAWALHLLWAVGLVYLMKHGANSISLDKLIRQA